LSHTRVEYPLDMALFATHKETKFGVGDRVRVTQKIKEGEKERLSVFEGMVIGIKGRGEGKSFLVRRVGAQQIGIEKIFPLALPTITQVEVVKKGVRGVRRAKLYYTRDKSRKEVDQIYKKAVKKADKVKSKIASKKSK